MPRRRRSPSQSWRTFLPTTSIRSPASASSPCRSACYTDSSCFRSTDAGSGTGTLPPELPPPSGLPSRSSTHFPRHGAGLPPTRPRCRLRGRVEQADRRASHRTGQDARILLGRIHSRNVSLGSIRRECFNHVIGFGEGHLRAILVLRALPPRAYASLAWQGRAGPATGPAIQRRRDHGVPQGGVVSNGCPYSHSPDGFWQGRGHGGPVGKERTAERRTTRLWGHRAPRG
jgi:hypothetical protein